MKLFEKVDVTGIVLPLEQVRLFTNLVPGWSMQNLTGDMQQEILRAGEKCLGLEIPMLPASLYRQFGRIGNRVEYENAYFRRRALLHSLVYAETLEQQGRFLDRIVDIIWLILEESTWVLPAHNSGELCAEYDEDIHNVDLFSAATAGVLSLSLYLLGERLNAGLHNQLLTRRMRYEIHRRVLLPINRYDMAWMCRTANNWNPWIFSNALLCLATCEDSLPLREGMIGRILHMLDNFVDRYGESGGCDEGPSYWGMAGGCLFDCLELLYDLTGGKLDLFGHPLVRNMGEYIMKMHICGNYFVTFADAPHKITSYDAMIARFGQRTGSEELERFGLARADALRHIQSMVNEHSNSHTVSYRILKDTVFLATAPTGGKIEHDLCHYLDDIQVMAARQSPNPDDGLFVAMKGGCNSESHNHNDVGNFVVYYNGEPWMVDAGVDTYSRTTFSPQRYTLWYMQSSYHNLPDINGTAQQEGGRYRASDVRFTPQRRELSIELSTAYPESAGIDSFRRTLRLDDNRVMVCDWFCLPKPGTVQEHYLFQEEPDLSTPGLLRFAAGPSMTYDPSLSPICEPVCLLTTVDLADGQDPRGNMARNWGKDVLYRVTLAGSAGACTEYRLVIEA